MYWPYWYARSWIFTIHGAFHKRLDYFRVMSFGWGVGCGRIQSFSAPCLASLLALSLPHMFMCAFIFLMVMLWFEVLRVYMM